MFGGGRGQVHLGPLLVVLLEGQFRLLDVLLLLLLGLGGFPGEALGSHLHLDDHLLHCGGRCPLRFVSHKMIINIGMLERLNIGIELLGVLMLIMMIIKDYLIVTVHSSINTLQSQPASFFICIVFHHRNSIIQQLLILHPHLLLPPIVVQ